MTALRIVGLERKSAYGCFDDRAAAGALLAAPLRQYRDKDTLVIGLPRGGVEVAEPLALRLDADLDVLVSRKLRAPQQPELAIGALAEGDIVSWNEDVIFELGLDREDRRRELERVRRELETRLHAYRSILPRAPVSDRTVILTDDGVATGATLRAAVEAISAAAPRDLVVALPGGPRETLAEFAAMRGVTDAVVLVVPEPFYAVGQLYVSFAQVSDDRVCEVLQAAADRRRARGAHPYT